jgi:2-keto-4-pentenoate hydratase/2-oxohepta-3-ene-1,7-dioic acid hydratase in catechol pathway
MKIIRCQDKQGLIGYAAQPHDGAAMKLRGDIFSEFSATDETAHVARLLAPVVPTGIICIGLNYRRHAAWRGHGAETAALVARRR